MSALPEPASFEPFLPDVYRFAFLMTGGNGDHAAAVLRRTVEHAAREGLGDLRDPRRIKRSLFIEARRHCAQSVAPPAAAPAIDPAATPETTDAANTPAPPLTDRFAVLPPAERGALILFYLYLFDPVELAEVLEIPSAELAPLLTRARALCRTSS